MERSLNLQLFLRRPFFWNRSQALKNNSGRVDSSAVHAESKSKIINCKLLFPESPIIPRRHINLRVFRTRMRETFSHSDRMLVLSSRVCVRKLPAWKTAQPLWQNSPVATLEAGGQKPSNCCHVFDWHTITGFLQWLDYEKKQFAEKRKFFTFAKC